MQGISMYTVPSLQTTMAKLVEWRYSPEEYMGSIMILRLKQDVNPSFNATLMLQLIQEAA